MPESEKNAKALTFKPATETVEETTRSESELEKSMPSVWPVLMSRELEMTVAESELRLKEGPPVLPRKRSSKKVVEETGTPASVV